MPRLVQAVLDDLERAPFDKLLPQAAGPLRFLGASLAASAEDVEPLIDAAKEAGVPDSEIATTLETLQIVLGRLSTFMNKTAAQLSQ